MLIMFWPSIQISPALGRIKPMRCLSRTLLPPPLRPIIASVSPRATWRSTPRKISCAPIVFTNPCTAIIEELPSSGEAAVPGGRENSCPVTEAFMLDRSRQSHSDTAILPHGKPAPLGLDYPAHNSIFPNSFRRFGSDDQEIQVAKVQPCRQRRSEEHTFELQS